jgi:ankyrin repeat protein
MVASTAIQETDYSYRLQYVQDGATPLHIAARCGNTEVVDALLEGSACISTIDHVRTGSSSSSAYVWILVMLRSGDTQTQT